jgi:tRNA(Ile)-lysidine synthase
MADLPWPGAVAVSGGGDSLALMHLLAHWARDQDAPPPLVLCVDHGLRPESGKDARAVARWARAAGLKSRILTVTGKKPKSNIEAWARTVRYSLMGRALARHGLKTLYLAHHQDDQAETFLLRLGRGSGLDGLSAMRKLSAFPLPEFSGLSLARPLLDTPRAALRDYLKARKQDWQEDPMNGEPRFARSRIRALLPALAEAGLSARRICNAAAHLARAREALELATAAVLVRVCARRQDLLLVDSEALAAAPREIGLRALAALLKTVSGANYRPRFDSLERLFDQLAGAESWGSATLHGCRIGPARVRDRLFGPNTLVITKESSRRPARGA